MVFSYRSLNGLRQPWSEIELGRDTAGARKGRDSGQGVLWHLRPLVITGQLAGPHAGNHTDPKIQSGLPMRTEHLILGKKVGKNTQQLCFLAIFQAVMGWNLILFLLWCSSSMTWPSRAVGLSFLTGGGCGVLHAMVILGFVLDIPSQS